MQNRLAEMLYFNKKNENKLFDQNIFQDFSEALEIADKHLDTFK